MTVVFTKPQMDWLQAEAERLGVSVAELVRRLIDECRARRKRDAH
jgi:hypothetical protein